MKPQPPNRLLPDRQPPPQRDARPPRGRRRRHPAPARARQLQPLQTPPSTPSVGSGCGQRPPSSHRPQLDRPRRRLHSPISCSRHSASPAIFLPLAAASSGASPGCAPAPLRFAVGFQAPSASFSGRIFAPAVIALLPGNLLWRHAHAHLRTSPAASSPTTSSTLLNLPGAAVIVCLARRRAIALSLHHLPAHHRAPEWLRWPLHPPPRALIRPLLRPPGRLAATAPSAPTSTTSTASSPKTTELRNKPEEDQLRARRVPLTPLQPLRLVRPPQANRPCPKPTPPAACSAYRDDLRLHLEEHPPPPTSTPHPIVLPPRRPTAAAGITSPPPLARRARPPLRAEPDFGLPFGDPSPPSSRRRLAQLPLRAT